MSLSLWVKLSGVLCISSLAVFGVLEFYEVSVVSQVKHLYSQIGGDTTSKNILLLDKDVIQRAAYLEKVLAERELYIEKILKEQPASQNDGTTPAPTQPPAAEAEECIPVPCIQVESVPASAPAPAAAPTSGTTAHPVGAMTMLARMYNMPAIQKILPALQQGKTNSYCQPVVEGMTIEELLKKRVGIAAVTHHTPKSLRNSLESWKKSGLLDLVDEKLMWVNSVNAVHHEHDLGHEFGFRVWDPLKFSWSKFQPGSTLLPANDFHNKPAPDENYPPQFKMLHDNSYTFPVSFFWVTQLAAVDYILVLEKDFAMDLELSYDEMVAELFTAVYQMAMHGVPYIRMRSRRDIGTAGMNDCVSKTCGYNAHGDTNARQANQFNFYNGAFTQGVEDCVAAPAPRIRCYSNVDANWSNNAMLLDRHWAIYKYRALIEVAGCMWSQNGDFEVEMINRDWGHTAQTNMCLMYQGLFRHQEIDG